MYDRIKDIVYPIVAMFVTSILNELGNKATQNRKAIRTISEFNGFFGLHDNIYNICIFWVNILLDLHNIVELPNTSDKLLQLGEQRTFNFFGSIYLFNIRKDTENGMTAAFQFWKIPKIQIRMDELLVDFLFERNTIRIQKKQQMSQVLVLFVHCKQFVTCKKLF